MCADVLVKSWDSSGTKPLIREWKSKKTNKKKTMKPNNKELETQGGKW